MSLLNEEQLKAVQHGDGPLLIIAGAGSGKTTVITERIKYLILEKGIHSSNILALTFTEKSAKEMEERIDVVMPYGYTQMWISTFHAFCDRILRNEAIHIGLNPSYKLMTEAEAILFLRKNLFKFNLNYFRPLGNPYKFLEGMLQHFSRLSDEDISPNEYIHWAQTQNEKDKDTEFAVDNNEIKKNLELANAYKTYEQLKTKEGIMDFSNLITNTLKLFRERKNILKLYQVQFKYILIDEFQDTNFAQNQLVILLAGEKKNITVVGDDDQAIYRFRGAAISNIIQFKEHFQKTQVITLNKNYRSTQKILDCAYKLITNNNPDRLEIKENINKKLISQIREKKSEIELLFADRVENEAELVVKKIQELIAKNNYKYQDFAILVRANDHAQSFVRELQRNNIPFQFLGPGKLFHQEEIKDLIAYLKVLYNFEDSSSFYRILTMPIFEIEPLEIASLLNYSRKTNLTLLNALENIVLAKENLNIPFLKDKTKEKLLLIFEMIKRHLAKIPKDSAGQILYYFLQDSGYLKKAKIDENVKKYQNIAKFFDKLKTFEAEKEDASVFAVIEWIDLSMQMGESPLASDNDWVDNNAVNILTVHSSKGLEFPVVFLVNLVTQRFPVRERREQLPIPQELIKEILPTGDFHLEEERRLFYVGLTRAKDHLFLTAANFYGEGKRERKISPFIYETLGIDNVEKTLNIHKEKKSVVQPSLLDWESQIQPSTLIVKPSFNLQPINYLSYSQLQSFDICPLHYKLKYILRIPTAPTAAQTFGTSIHAALRDFYVEFSKKQDTILKIDVEKLLLKNWVREGYQNKTHEKDAFEKALFILESYFKKYIKENEKLNLPLILETPFTFLLKNQEKSRVIKIGGRIDRVDKIDKNSIEIIDYKTGNNVPEQKELEKNLQLTLYALAATKMLEIPFNKKPEEVVLSLHYLETDQKLTTTRTKEQLEKAENFIFEKVEEIEKSNFACKASSFCQNCEYKILCQS